MGSTHRNTHRLYLQQRCEAISTTRYQRTINSLPTPHGAGKEGARMPRIRKSEWSHFSLAAPAEDQDAHHLLSVYLRVRRLSHSPATVRRIERCCCYWICACARRHVDARKATLEDALAVLDAWQGPDGWSAGSIRHFIGACRGWHDWMADHDHTDAANPFARIRAPKPASRIPRVLTPEEVRRMVAALNKPHWRDLRDRAMILVLYSTGCRSAELLGMNTGDIDMASGTAVVMGKGHKEGLVYLLEPALDALRVYLSAVRPVLLGDRDTAGPLFLGREGRRAGVTALRDAIIRSAQRAGIGRHVHPHMFRHSAATHLLKAGADLRAVQEVLRHADIGSTQIYTHLDDQDVAEAHRKYHPLSNPVNFG